MIYLLKRRSSDVAATRDVHVVSDSSQSKHSQYGCAESLFGLDISEQHKTSEQLV